MTQVVDMPNILRKYCIANQFCLSSARSPGSGPNAFALHALDLFSCFSRFTRLQPYTVIFTFRDAWVC